MRKLVLLAAGLALALAATSQADANVAGTTVRYKNSKGQTYWTTYNKNGTSFTKSTTANGSAGFMYDSGKWRYEQGRLCEQYSNWSGGREFCR